MENYTEMLKTQAKTYDSTVERMDIANRAYANSDEYECILLDVYFMNAKLATRSKHDYLKIAASIPQAEFDTILDGTHPLVQ